MPAPTNPTLYHHSSYLEYIKYGVMKANYMNDPAPKCPPGQCDFDDWHDQASMELAYRWLEKQVGYKPLFLAVGRKADDKRMTGYQLQFKYSPESLKKYPERKKSIMGTRIGTPQVLFSYKEKPSPKLCFTDYDNWHIILNEAINQHVSYGNGKHSKSISLISEEQITRLIMRKSWSDTKWLRAAEEHTHGVQAVTPFIDTRLADQVWVPNEKIFKKLIKLGFKEDQLRIKYLADYEWL